MCGQNEEHRQGVCPQDSQQVGDVETGGNRLLPRREGCPCVWRQEVDHKPSLCLSRHYKLSKYFFLSIVRSRIRAKPTKYVI